MHNWFLCKIKYEKTLENGLNKTVAESYLVDALSHTEAEARIIEEMKPYMSGEFTVLVDNVFEYHAYLVAHVAEITG